MSVMVWIKRKVAKGKNEMLENISSGMRALTCSRIRFESYETE